MFTWGKKEKPSKPTSTHISTYISNSDSFSFHAKQLNKGFLLSLFSKNSDDRARIQKLGEEADKTYRKPADKNNIDYLSKIYKEAKVKANSYVSKHPSPKTGEGKRLLHEAHEVYDSANQEQSIIKSKAGEDNTSNLSIQNILFNTTTSYSTTDFNDFKENQTEYEGYYGEHGDGKHRNKYLDLANKDLNSLNEKEKIAMDEYTNDSGEINTALRNGNYEKGKADKTLSDNITNMKAAFAKHNLPDSLTTYRGVDDGMIKYWLGLKGVDKDQASEFMDENGDIDHSQFYSLGAYKLLNGITFSDKAFVSTTTNRFFARRWSNEIVNKRKKAKGKKFHGKEIYQDTEGSHLMVMHIPKGTRAMFTDTMFTRTGTSRGQDELTLDAGYSYTVNNVKAIKPGIYEFNTTVHGDTEEINVDKKHSFLAEHSSESFIGNYSNLPSLFNDMRIRLNSLFDKQSIPKIESSINNINTILEGNKPSWGQFSNHLKNINSEAKALSTNSNTSIKSNFLKQVENISDPGGVLQRRIAYYSAKKNELEPDVKIKDLFSPQKMYKTAKNIEQKNFNEDYSDIVFSILDEQEAAVVKDYTGNSYIEYNAVERGTDGHMDETKKNTYKKRSNKLAETINKFTTKKEDVYYRGFVNFHDLKFMLSSNIAGAWTENFTVDDACNLINQNAGGTLLEKGYMSVSNSKKVSLGFGGNTYFKDPKTNKETSGAFLKITIPAGVSALPIMKNSEHAKEEELLLNRGTKLQIISAKRNSNGVLVVEAKAIPNSQ